MYIKLNQDINNVNVLIKNKNNHCAFILLSVILMRLNSYSKEARIGDHENFGLSRYEYRKAIEILEKHGFCTFKKLRHFGTIAKLIKVEIIQGFIAN